MAPEAKDEVKTGGNRRTMLIIGGVCLALGIGVYFYEKNKSSTTVNGGSSTGSTATSSSVGSGTTNNPYVAGGTGTSVIPPNSFLTETGSSFAGQIAQAFGSQFPNWRTTTNPSPLSPGSGTVPPTGGGGGAQPKPGVTPHPSAVTPPQTITVRGVTFKPTRQVNVGGATYYGVPNQPTAAQLKKGGATLTSLFGGHGLYVQG